MKNENKKWMIAVIILVVIIIVMAVVLIINTSKISILSEEVEVQKQSYEAVKKEKTEIVNNYNNLLKENEELKQTSKQKEINDKITALQTQQTSLEKQVSDKNAELENLKSDIIKAKQEPKTYPAGMYTVGQNMPSGRYKVYGGSSNFTVYSASGSLKVNTILGDDKYSTPEYICNFNTGDVVNARSSFKIVEVE